MSFTKVQQIPREKDEIPHPDPDKSGRGDEE